MSVADLTKEALSEAKNVLTGFGMAYVKLTVQEQLIPMIKDALKEAMEEAKEESKGETKEGQVEMKPRLLYDQKEPNPDITHVWLYATTTEWNWYGNAWTGYQMVSVRIGSDAKAHGSFYARGSEDLIRHGHVSRLYRNIGEEFKENKDAKLPPLFADHLHGYQCGCIQRKPPAESFYHTSRGFFDGLRKKPWNASKAIADFFSIGDNWEEQQRRKKITKAAALLAAEDFLGRRVWWREMKVVFDESDAIRGLMGLVIDYRVMGRLRAKVNPPVCKYQAKNAAENTVMDGVNTTMATWETVQKGFDKVQQEVGDLVKKGAEELGKNLKPIIKKVFAKLQEKTKPKETKEEVKDVSDKIGDFVGKYKFENSSIGQKLAKALDGDSNWSSWNALNGLRQDLNPQVIIANSLKDFAGTLGGYGFMTNPVVEYVIKELAKDFGRYFNRFNTIDGTLRGAQGLFEARDKTEKELIALAGKSAEEAAKVIDAMSTTFWSELADCCGDMLWQFTRIRRASIDEVRRDFDGGNPPDEVEEAVIDCVNNTFKLHVQALNAVRVGYCQKLKESLTGGALASADTVRAAVRAAWKAAVFENIKIVLEDQWTMLAETLIFYSQHVAYAWFIKNVYEEFKEFIEAINGLLPKQVADMKIVDKLLRKVFEVVIFKGVGAAMKKLVPLVEKVLFSQAEEQKSS